jgi:hypothetical protein
MANDQDNSGEVNAGDSETDQESGAHPQPDYNPAALAVRESGNGGVYRATRVIGRAVNHRWPVTDAMAGLTAGRLSEIVERRVVTMRGPEGAYASVHHADQNATRAAAVLVSMMGQNQTDDWNRERDKRLDQGLATSRVEGIRIIESLPPQAASPAFSGPQATQAHSASSAGAAVALRLAGAGSLAGCGGPDGATDGRSDDADDATRGEPNHADGAGEAPESRSIALPGASFAPPSPSPTLPLNTHTLTHLNRSRESVSSNGTHEDSPYVPPARQKAVTRRANKIKKRREEAGVAIGQNIGYVAPPLRAVTVNSDDLAGFAPLLPPVQIGRSFDQSLARENQREQKVVSLPPAPREHDVMAPEGESVRDYMARMRQEERNG